MNITEDPALGCVRKCTDGISVSESNRHRRIALTGWIHTDATGRIAHDNVGDELSYYILSAIARDKVVLADVPEAVHAEKAVAFVGSVFHLIKSEKVEVWGTGVHAPDMMPKVRPAAIHAVRGPLSRDLLVQAGLACPEVYGDPVLLLPYLFTPRVTRRFKLGLIPHCHDQELPHFRSFCAEHPEVCVIRMRGYDDWRDVVRKICSCDFVVSSSLHGMVIADAYGVPNLFMKLSDIPIGGEFQFKDYCAGVGREYVAPLNFREEVRLDEIKGANYRRPTAINLQPLLAASPVALREEFVARVVSGAFAEMEPVPPPRILFTSTAANLSNPFVNVISERLWRLGCVVEAGADKFWTCNPSDYDILQLQWPEDLVRWKLDEITEGRLDSLARRLAAFHTAGCKICYTRHNTIPHNVQNDLTCRLYRAVEEAADAVFHMSDYSRKAFRSVRAQRHFIIPHHTYEDFDRTIPQAEARQRLGIDCQDRVVLAFGAFRNESEKNLVRDAIAACQVTRLKLLAPSLNGARVPDEELPDYFAAADVIFIQRLEILNSGNLPMAFYFGKIVAGPDVGDVGEILRAAGNPVFDPFSCKSAAQAIERAFTLASSGFGTQNQALADREWNSPCVARKMLDAYADCLGRRLSHLVRHCGGTATRRVQSATSKTESEMAMQLAKVDELRSSIRGYKAGIETLRDEKAVMLAKVDELRSSIRGYKGRIEKQDELLRRIKALTA
ncbi:MAG: polysaccharide pyruvyl transferase family protein [Kiritimatiellia bacterium]